MLNRFFERDEMVKQVYEQRRAYSINEEKLTSTITQYTLSEMKITNLTYKQLDYDIDADDEEVIYLYREEAEQALKEKSKYYYYVDNNIIGFNQTYDVMLEFYKKNV